MRKLFFLFLLLSGASKVMQAQITWNFTAATATGAPTNLTSGSVTQGSNNGTTTFLAAGTPPSSVYPGFSAGNNGNFSAKTTAFSLTTSTYLQAIVTPAAGYWLNITGIRWGNFSLATTGPTTLSVYASDNNFVTSTLIATSTVVQSTTAWTQLIPTITPYNGLTGTAVTIRIYASGGTGTTPAAAAVNWRVDDLVITATAQTGTVGQIPKYSAGNTFNNSIISENNSNIGIGITTPTQKLDVAGGIKFTGALLAGTIPTGGVSGQFLQSTGPTSAPVWAAAAGGGGTTLNGTGFVKMAGTTPSYISLIPNTDLANTAVATLSGTNTGDNAPNTLYSGLVSNAAHTGDASGNTALTVNGIKNVAIPALATGNLKYNGTAWVFDNSALTSFTETDPIVKAVNGLVKSNGTTVSAATAGTDYLTPTGSAAGLTSFPTLNQNTTGTAATITGTVTQSQVANLTTDLDAKQVNLVSGTNIKTINGSTILGAGDIVIASPSENDPIVKAVNGMVKSNGTTISAAVAGTDYLSPTGSAADLTSFPVLNQNTTGNAATATTATNLSGGIVGSIPYQSATGITTLLSPGFPGFMLTSGAVGAPPVWKQAFTGGGLYNYLPRYTQNGSVLGNSQIYDNSTSVGIGTTNPIAKLDIAGNIKIADGTQGLNKVLTSDANGLATWTALPAVTNTGWGLLGNANTNPSTNFIGTTDNNDVVFKRDNIKSGLISTENVALGFNSLGISSTGVRNVAMGAYALAINTSGSYNVAVGAIALPANTSGHTNTAIGDGALAANTTGHTNAASGAYALVANTSGFSNTATGTQALASNLTGNYNVATGRYALNFNTAGNDNVATGLQSLYNTKGSNNVAMGSYSFLSNTTGSNNVGIGYRSNVNTGTLTNAIAIGAYAMVGQSNSMVLGSIAGVNGASASTNIGIGTSTPETALHVVGGLKFVDGSQGAGKILTSDANGLASWSALPAPPATGWGLTGNAGTIAGTNFIGTSDLTDLVFKTNNSERLKLTSGGKTRFFHNTWNTNINNLFSIGDSTFNVFDISTSTASADGQSTIFKFRGNNAAYNDTWSFNIEQGYNTKFNSGAYADYQSFNFAGSEKMRINQFGNVGIGTATPTTRLDIAGAIKITDGTQGINKVLTSDANGLASWQLPQQTSVSVPSLQQVTTVGKVTTDTVTVRRLISENDITVNGYRMGVGGNGSANNYGVVLGNALAQYNVANTNMAIGGNIMNVHQSGNYNIGIGGNVLSLDSTGIGNLAIGAAAMNKNVNGRYNIALGYSTFSQNKYGYFNTIVGNGAATATPTATDTLLFNSIFGYAAAKNRKRGKGNVMVGIESGGYSANGIDSCVFLGQASGANETRSNQLNIANGSLKSLIAGDFYNNQVQINGTGTPVYTSSAAFEVKSPNNNQGAIPYPIMTDAQRLAIPNPAVGLHIFQTDGTEGIWIYKSTGWAFIGGGGTAGWGLTGNAGTNPATNFIGTTDSVPFIIKVKGNQVAKFGTLANISMGDITIASGYASTAMGASTTASGFVSTAMGGNTTASGILSTTMGEATIASNHASTAMGYTTTASGFASTAMGDNTIAAAYGSTTMGLSTSASVEASTAMGKSTAASGVASTSMGEGTTAKSYAETSIGLYNTNYTPMAGGIWQATDRLFSLGNGVDNNNRSDAFTILKSGNTGIGTSEPTAQLHTTNTVRFEKFKNNNAMDSVLTTDTSGNLKLKYFVGGAGGVDNSKWTLVGNNIYSRDSANVGIGVTATTAKLHAKGTIRFESLKNNAAKDSVLTTDSSGNLSMKYLSADNSKWRLIGNNIYSRDSAYVGVGTDSATAKFHALGSMRFESFKNNPQGDSVLTTDISGNLKMVYLPYGSGGGGGGATYTFKNGVTQSNGIVNIGGALEDTVNLNLAGYAFNINNGTQKVLTTSAINNNIGIGTSPVAAYRMSVNGDANIGNVRDTAGVGNKLWFNGAGNGDNIWMSRFNTVASNTDLRMNIGNGAGISNDRLDVGYDSANNWNSKFVVQNNGMVGIGTTQLNGLLSVGSAHGSKLAIGNNAWTKTSVISTGNNANADGDFTDLLVAGQNNNNAVLRINSKGNVGIGTSVNTALDSTYRLSVNGKIRAKGLRVQTTGWADFVFEPGYKLKSLIEVEAFINKNKHLPEMLPASNVIAEGNDVGETQVKLLQKVEELTLYLIDQDKQLKKLQEQNKALETQNKEIENLKKQMDEMKALLQKAK